MTLLDTAFELPGKVTDKSKNLTETGVATVPAYTEQALLCYSETVSLDVWLSPCYDCSVVVVTLTLTTNHKAISPVKTKPYPIALNVI